VSSEESEKIIQELKKRIEDLEKASIAKSEFLANMSHELRSPMTSVIGMSHMLLETELNAEQRDCAEVISTSATGLLNLINDTLDISKLDAKKVELETIPFNLYGLIEQVCRGFSLQINKKNLSLAIDYPPDHNHQFKGDPARIRQVLTNFISNAIKFTSEGGVTVSMSQEPLENDHVEVSVIVTDTGDGIPTGSLRKIFNKFEQADASTTRRYGGTGLGLAICNEIAELMSGTVGVESEVGKGSSFWLRFPLIAEEEESKTMDQGEIQGKVVLLVDPNPSTAKILARNMESSGIVCFIASTANEALEILKSKPKADLVITDFDLADMNGAELGISIAKTCPDKTPHLVMLTSMGRKGDSQLMSDAGFEAYFVKPTSSEVLLEALSFVIGGDQTPGNLITKYTLSEAKASKNHHDDKVLIQDEGSQNPSPDGEEELSSVHLVIAEDDPMIQKVLKKLMKKWGQEFTLVDNGRDAVEAVKQHGGGMVLMDWHMPIQDGLSATRDIRTWEGEQRRTWIIGLTAGGADEAKAKCLDAGMDLHQQKPFDIPVFQKIFKQGLANAASLMKA
jgi:CheY-like chemotaxis protein